MASRPATIRTPGARTKRQAAKAPAAKAPAIAQAIQTGGSTFRARYPAAPGTEGDGNPEQRAVTLGGDLRA